jgi:hypothetical protein
MDMDIDGDTDMNYVCVRVRACVHAEHAPPPPINGNVMSRKRCSQEGGKYHFRKGGGKDKYRFIPKYRPHYVHVHGHV